MFRGSVVIVKVFIKGELLRVFVSASFQSDDLKRFKSPHITAFR